ncbi:hypothetical protein CDD83_9010 [Cordyceps sp. RAO-2017]|nr:hypothetical protein CDD83_9010 [Cordyceps sp. RAO-2017]
MCCGLLKQHPDESSSREVGSQILFPTALVFVHPFLVPISNHSSLAAREDICLHLALICLCFRRYTQLYPFVAALSLPPAPQRPRPSAQLRLARPSTAFHQSTLDWTDRQSGLGQRAQRPRYLYLTSHESAVSTWPCAATEVPGDTGSASQAVLAAGNRQPRLASVAWLVSPSSPHCRIT